MRATTLQVQSAKRQKKEGISELIRTSDDFSRAQRIANMDIGLRYLTENEQYLNYLPLHVCRRIAATRHYVQKRR